MEPENNVGFYQASMTTHVRRQARAPLRVRCQTLPITRVPHHTRMYLLMHPRVQLLMQPLKKPPTQPLMKPIAQLPTQPFM